MTIFPNRPIGRIPRPTPLTGRKPPKTALYRKRRADDVEDLIDAVADEATHMALRAIYEKLDAE